MTLPLHTLATRVLTTTLCGAALAACGGGSAPQNTAAASGSSDRHLSIYSGRSVTGTPPTTSPTSGTSSTSVATGTITTVRLENTSATTNQTNVPVTFGQIFAPGDLASDVALVGRLENGSSVPLQVDIKAKHADGSVRHAILSAIVPSLAAGKTVGMELVRNGIVSATSTTMSPAQLLSNGFTAAFTATIGGVQYKASADELLKAGKATTWLAGSTANEWHVSAPLATSTGAQHPHLTARFAIRWYGAVKKARVDVVVENNWAYEPAPQNFTYDAQVIVGGKPVYTQAALTHLHHARWRKLFWFGAAAPELNVKQNTGYLIASRALPNYDQSLVIPETTLASLKTRWTNAKTGPMGNGLAISYMPAAGGREDIGLLPTWNALYLLSMDKRARDAALGTADLAGSWSSHYRDKQTGQPVSLIDYPYMTIAGRPTDTKNPATGKYESFPACATTTACQSPHTHDVSHQPGFAYLPYMVTGDHYYLEELQFWGMYNMFNSNPGYRENIKGLLKPEQVRGQAWALRTLAEVTYITPDTDRLKSHFARLLDSNLDWYNAEYTNNTNANKLGVLVNGYAVAYKKGTGIAPWMDDFFTSAVGHAAELGFEKAVPLLKWKAKFPISRMIGEGSCLITGAMYSMVIRDSATSPFYTTIAQAFQASDTPEFLALGCNTPAQAAFLKLKLGEMTGYSAATAGYPSNMQPGLAMSVDVSGTEGAEAWKMFMSRTVKPDYRTAPQFAIIPRK